MFGKDGKDGARAIEGMVRRETDRGVKEAEESVVEKREETVVEETVVVETVMEGGEDDDNGTLNIVGVAS